MHKGFTRREKHIVIILVVTLVSILFSGVDQQTLNDHEYLFLLFYVAPLGVYIATDPQRRI